MELMVRTWTRRAAALLGLALMGCGFGGGGNSQEEIALSTFLRNDQFGHAVALEGNRALIGGLGKAVITHFSRSVWSEEARLVPLNPPEFGGIVNSVALFGNTALVGMGSAHRAWIFERIDGAWVEVAELSLAPSSDTSQSFFGTAVALSGPSGGQANLALIGAPGVPRLSAPARAGAAYVFARVAGTWVQQETIPSPDPRAGAGFGSAVALTQLQGPVVALIGAPGFDVADSGFNIQGRAYGMRRDEEGWILEATLHRSGTSIDRFGHAVALSTSSGQTALVGAPLAHGTGEGAVQVYIRDNDGTWRATSTFRNPMLRKEHEFGESVSIHGNEAIVGAPAVQGNSRQTGRAVRFRRIFSRWSDSNQYEPADSSLSSFAASVAVHGLVRLVGSPLHAHGQNPITSGGVYVYR